METTQIVIAVGLLIVALAVVAVYAFWLKNRHHHKSRTTVD